MKSTKVTFKGDYMFIDLDEELEDKLYSVAKKLKVSPSILAEKWLMEKVNEDLTAQKLHAKNYSV